MSDLQDVISRLERVIQTGATDKDGKHPISAEFVLEELKSIADRPSGEWIYKDDPIFAGKYYCDNCDSQAEVDLYGEWILSDYCPHCGARMRGADDGEDIQSTDE